VVDYRGGEEATVYASTQGTFTISGEAAKALGFQNQNAVTTSSSLWAAVSARSSGWMSPA